MQFAVLALSAFTLFSSTYALTLNTPDLAVSGEPIDITWENGPHDSTFSLELFSATLQDSFALANNVNPDLDHLELTLPVVPA